MGPLLTRMWDVLLALHFDGTINAGTVISAAGFMITILVLYHKAVKCFVSLEAAIERHTDKFAAHQHQLQAHGERMDRYEAAQDVRMQKYEQRYLELAGHLQVVIGWMEGADRRRWPRAPKADA